MKTKTCSKCKKTRPANLLHFYKDTRISSGLTAKCKTCRSRESQDQYSTDDKYRKKKLANAAKYQKTVRRDFQIRILTLMKRSGCVDCGEKDPIVLDFDHMYDKTEGISRMIRDHRSWEAIEIEIAKCVVRCSNCHRKKTAKERNWYAEIDLSSL
jgi:hypothetical protein